MGGDHYDRQGPDRRIFAGPNAPDKFDARCLGHLIIREDRVDFAAGQNAPAFVGASGEENVSDADITQNDLKEYTRVVVVVDNETGNVCEPAGRFIPQLCKGERHDGPSMGVRGGDSPIRKYHFAGPACSLGLREKLVPSCR